jgi:hypothetical protein
VSATADLGIEPAVGANDCKFKSEKLQEKRDTGGTTAGLELSLDLSTLAEFLAGTGRGLFRDPVC